MNFREYDAAVARMYELGSYAIGHQHYPISFFKQAKLPILNRKQSKWIEGGCGTLRYSLGMLKVLRKQGEDLSKIVIDAFDISEPMLRIGERKAIKRDLQARIRLWKADGHDLSYAHEFYNQQTNGRAAGFPEEIYDGGIISGMFECIPDPIKAGREFSARIKPGGMLIIPLVNGNMAGKFASKILRFNIIPPEEILPQFGRVEFERFPVRFVNKFLEDLTTVWIGYKKD